MDRAWVMSSRGFEGSPILVCLSKVRPSIGSRRACFISIGRCTKAIQSSSAIERNKKPEA